MGLDIVTNTTDHVDLVLVDVGNIGIAMKANQVKEVIGLGKITRVPRATSFVAGVTNIRGQIITVVDLAKKFQVFSGEFYPDKKIVIVSFGKMDVGLIVDSISEVIRLPLTSIREVPLLIHAFGAADYVEGIIKHNGRLLLVTDVSRLLSPSELEVLGSLVSS